MVEVIVLSDDEGEAELPSQSSQAPEKLTCHSNAPRAVEQNPRRLYKLVLVDSRRCPRMPRPKFLPITWSQEAPSVVSEGYSEQFSGLPCRNRVTPSAEFVAPVLEEGDDEEDSDYEDLRPLKRRRTGIKKMPKKHGRLTAPDWEIVRNGAAGLGPFFPPKAASDRKEAREYVKRLTANVDWEDTLRRLEMLRLSAVQSGQSGTGQQGASNRPRRVPCPAKRLKQYWQGVLTKSVLKMDISSEK